TRSTMCRHSRKQVNRFRDRPPGASRRSRLAFRLEHGGGERLPALLAGPDDVLEGLVVALAGLERRLQQGLALVRRGERAVQHQALPEHDEAFVRPQIEVT